MISHPVLRGLLLCVLLMAGCATLPPPARPATESIVAFAFNGRLVVRQGDTRHHVRIDWRHDATRDDILLISPLGQGVAEITRDASGARLLLADKREFTAADAGTLAEQVFGFRLPLDHAARWLLGEPGNIAPWRATVVERESAAPDALPSVIELERDDIHVRLKIDEWSELR
ncbi:MAG: outer membrane lipoprotein LolB [Rhodocyclaceae bacterium]|nr:outer membrane lipoprotein LolB [Rhodocyclaceae bacterium]MDZ4214470.1 outer membrane lipoprotein LolB [Rhodocyclaceae bacterium]